VGGGFREDAYGLLPGFAAGSRVAGYRLQERVGAGGMAVVFRALDERLDRPVALKILAPALAADEVFRRRFVREAKAAAAVDDPHIIPVFEAGQAGGALFIAMRFVPGGDVRSLVRRAGALAAGRVAGIVSSVASALDAAHDAGLVHRDVKPANILVDARPGRPDHVYLSDFGLCQGALSFSGPGRRGQFLGTVGYAAPEQIRGGPVDGRADQYALACTAFELLSGAPPFPRDRPDAVIWGHVSQPPPLLTSRRPGFPAAADGVLTRALAKAPGDRYASCQDFADALRAALSLAPPSREVAIGLQDDHWQAGTTWPSIGDAEPAEDAPVAAAAARVSRGRGEVQPSTVGRGLRTVPPGPATRPKQARHARARTQPPHRNRRRFRLSVMPAAMLAAVLSVLGALAHLHSDVFKVSPPPAPFVNVAEPANYLGVYVPGRPAYRPVADFAAAARKQPNLAGYVTAWGEPFAASFARTLYRHGVTPFVQIDPTLASVSAIASGADDAYLRSYADSVRDYSHSVVIGFGHEMNATWYSWGYTRTSAPTFVAAWRHIVTLFRQQSADNVTWLWTIQADQPGTGPIRSWWPGTNYVTWVGIDGFYTKPSDSFGSVFVPTIEQVRSFTQKPILLSETAVPRRADQYTSIINLLNGMVQYRLLGLVWFDQDEYQQATPPGDPAVGGRDWRLEDSPLGRQAFRFGISGMNLVQP
jgi:Protein kinase domain/Glycosyl hydrolase family 26